MHNAYMNVRTESKHTYMYVRTCICTHIHVHVHEERLGNIFRELSKTGSHPGLNQGPLT